MKSSYHSAWHTVNAQSILVVTIVIVITLDFKLAKTW